MHNNEWNDATRECIKGLVDADNVSCLKRAFSDYMAHLVINVNDDNRSERIAEAMKAFDAMTDMEKEFYAFKSSLINFSTTAADLG